MPTRRTLLLADDSPATRKVISLTLEEQGLRVVAVGSGGEALSHLEQETPDIILADVHMPAPNGYELCAHVKRDERLRRVPVLLLVGRFEVFDKAEARRVGADGVLTKQPFQSIRELVSKVGGLLGGHPEPKASDETARDEEFARAESPANAWRVAEATPADASPAAASAPANFDLDDETIQTVPADSYTARAEVAVADEPDVEVFSFAGEDYAAGGVAASAPSGFVGESAAPAARFGGAAAQSYEARQESHSEARQESHSYAAAASGFGSHASAAPAGFDARPPAPPAEDSLLDLDDDLEAAPAADPDDFILDFDDAPPFARHEPATFDAAPAEEAAPRAEEASVLEALPTHVEGSPAEISPAEISPANLSSAWHDFDHSPVSADADALTVPGVESAATIFEYEEAPQTVGHADEATRAVGDTGSEAAPTIFDSVASESDFEIVKPPVVEDRAESVRAEFADESSARESAAGPANFAAHESAQGAGVELSQETIDAIARRVVEQMSERVLREIAWEVVPDLAERLIRQRLEEEKMRTQ